MLGSQRALKDLGDLAVGSLHLPRATAEGLHGDTGVLFVKTFQEPANQFYCGALTGGRVESLQRNPADAGTDPPVNALDADASAVGTPWDDRELGNIRQPDGLLRRVDQAAERGAVGDTCTRRGSRRNGATLVEHGRGTFHPEGKSSSAPPHGTRHLNTIVLLIGALVTVEGQR